MAKIKYVVFFIIFNISGLLLNYLFEDAITKREAIITLISSIIVTAILYYLTEKNAKKKALDSES